MAKDAVLCYVKGPWAYFTTRDLKAQWGDDWDDAPYEHNAEEPYEYNEHDQAAGVEHWEIIKVAWSGPYHTPDDGRINSPWSVEQINSGAVAWLIPDKWAYGHAAAKAEPIMAGTTLQAFCEKLRAAGGIVYMEKTA